MKKAQTFIEYTILFMIVVAALLTMQVYIKRGFQGRWKQTVDDLGEQYDKSAFNSEIRYTTTVVSESRTQAIPTRIGGKNGMITYRTDNSYSIDTKTGGAHIDPAGL